jgi:hypothetical protein
MKRVAFGPDREYTLKKLVFPACSTVQQRELARLSSKLAYCGGETRAHGAKYEFNE